MRFRSEHLPEDSTETGSARSRARTGLSLSSGNTFVVPLDMLYEYGSRLGHRDVLENMSDPHVCEECGDTFANLQDLKDCDNGMADLIKRPVFDPI